MRYGLKIIKKTKKTTSASLDRPSHGYRATPTAVKVTGVIPWIHHTRVKKAVASCDEDTWKAVWDPQNLLKVQFQRQQLSSTKDESPGLITPEAD